MQPGDVRGYAELWVVDVAKRGLVLAGWTADLTTHARPPAVIVFGDRVVATALPTIDRPDVAKAFNDDEVLRSGYQLRVPLSALEGAGRVRVFGLSVDGVASELHYPPEVTDEQPVASPR